MVTTTLPSSVMLTCAEDSPPALNQKPDATPRPCELALQRRLVMRRSSSRLPASRCSRCADRPGRARPWCPPWRRSSAAAPADPSSALRRARRARTRPHRRRSARPARDRPRPWSGWTRTSKPIRQHVRDVVGRKAAADRAADRRARERARLQVEGAVRGDDGAVLLGADLHRALRARGRPRGPHHLLARHHHLHRPAGSSSRACVASGSR